MFKSLAWIVAVIFLLCSASSKYKQKHLAHLQNPQITWFLLWCSYTQVFLSCQNLGNDTKIKLNCFYFASCYHSHYQFLLLTASPAKGNIEERRYHFLFSLTWWLTGVTA